MKKIAIIGVHSAGKTSLAYILSAHFKMKHLNVKLIHESVRENCPFPINEKANQDTCLWNFHKQFLNEFDAKAQGYEMAICDRSVMDTFVYYHAVNPESNITRAAVQQASQWLETYDLLICLEPSEFIDPVDDGYRATDREYQNLIRDGFRKIIKDYGSHVQDKILYASSEDIFDEDRRIQFIETVEEKVDLPLKQLCEVHTQTT